MMPVPGLVSIIIPAFNAEAFVGDAIGSALRQSYAAIEVIVVNDGSRDATSAVMHRLAAADGRVITIDLEARGGVSAARNAGLRRARGEWIALLDADDTFAPKRIERLLAVAVRHDADMVADNLRLRDFATGADRGLAFPTDWLAEEAEVTVRYVLERDIAGLYRREMAFIKPIIRRLMVVQHQIAYRENIVAGEDLLFYIDCLRAGGRMKLVQEAFYSYALRPGSVSSNAAANLGCLQANQILQEQFRDDDAAIAALLNLRGAAIGWELLIWHVRSGRLHKVLPAALKIPSKFLAMKLNRAVRRRLGMTSVDPAAVEIERIRARAAAQPAPSSAGVAQISVKAAQ